MSGKAYARGILVLALALLLSYVATTRAEARVYLPSLDLVVGPDSDIGVAGGLPMTFDRYYASQSTFAGMLGYGWEDRFEAKLDVLPDGSYEITEFGGGATHQFVPPTQPRTTYNITRELMAAADRINLFGNDAERTAYEKSLSDDSVRKTEWQRFVDLGLVSDPNVAIGETFQSTSGDFVTRVPEGYERRASLSDEYEAFSGTGRLQRIWDADHNFVQVDWKAIASRRLASSLDRIETLRDGLGNAFTFSYTYNSNWDDWLATRIDDHKHHRFAAYRYDQYLNLIYNRNMAGVTSVYSYDKYHNLIRVVRNGVVEMKITYADPGYGTVGSVTDAERNVIAFNSTDERDAQRKLTAVLIDVQLTRADGTTQAYQYRYPVDKDGNYDYAHKTGPPPPALTIHVGGQRVASPGTWVMQ